MPTQKQVMDKLEEVMDPELYISIVDLGLVYGIDILDGNVDIKMTLTTIGCPLFSLIEKDVKDKIKKLKNVKKIHVELVFDPPWSMDRMSEKGKAVLGI
jgi:metal-sulfur cluster biosynthetic enzyme